MSNRDEDKWIALIEGVKNMLSNHVDNQEHQVDSADNCHDSKTGERRFHGHTLTWELGLVTTLIERSPENERCHKPPDGDIGDVLPVVAGNIALRQSNFDTGSGDFTAASIF